MGKGSFSDIFAKYKTYDPSKEGYGSASQWKSAFRERMGWDEAEEIVNDIKEEHPPLVALRACKTLLELKKTYRSLMMQHHPDKGGDVRKAQEIVALYTVLEAKLK